MIEPKRHSYEMRVEWTGNRGRGTQTYDGYGREHTISAAGKPVIQGSSDPAFRGDPARYNPEELLVASLSACHMLWYLHLCAVNEIVVTSYADAASGQLVETADGGGHFIEVLLRPVVTISQDGNVALAEELHDRAHDLCFIASSVNFPVRCEPTTRIENSTR